MNVSSISPNLRSTIQQFSARFTRWQAPPSCQAQQYQNHIDHFERGLKALISPGILRHRNVLRALYPLSQRNGLKDLTPRFREQFALINEPWKCYRK